MKLKNLPIKETFVKHSFSLYQSQSDLLGKYRNYVASSQGIEITDSELITSVVTTFMDEDKSFQKWLKSQTTQSSKSFE